VLTSKNGGLAISLELLPGLIDLTGQVNVHCFKMYVAKNQISSRNWLGISNIQLE